MRTAGLLFFISPVISTDPSTLDVSERPCISKGLYIYMFIYIHLNKQVPVRCQEAEVTLGKRGTTKNNEKLYQKCIFRYTCKLG